MVKAVRILVDSNKSRIVGSLKVVSRLHGSMKLKSPGYFFSPAYRRRVWDGYTRYVTETGTFSTGHIDWVIEELKKIKCKYILEDKREHFKDLHLVTQLGDKELRGYQLEAVKAFLDNRFEGIKFIRGVLNEATNAGKNLIAAAIYSSFSQKRRGLFLIDNRKIFAQAVKELSEMMPGEVGSIQGKKIKWGRITIAMVQTLGPLAKRNPTIRRELEKQDIVLVDECDSTVPKKPCQTILAYCFNAPIRGGMSGTPFCHKEQTRNLLVKSFFGPEVHAITNKELVELGVSSKPHFRILQGNTKHIYPGNYVKEYRRGIIKSRERNKHIWHIVKRQDKKDRGPFLILFKNHLHADYLIKYMPKDLDLRYEVVHHKTPNAEAIFERFMKGEIEVLIASMIIKRGMNIGIMKTLINAAGGDSQANVKQILGRGLRKIKGVKEEIWVYDFWDFGKYLRRHSNHRLIFYKKEGFKVLEKFKKQLFSI